MNVRTNDRPREQGVVAATSAYPHPRPRLAGFSPLIAMTATNQQSTMDIDYEHDLHVSYHCDPYHAPTPTVCGPLNPPATQRFIVGILDSGSVVDLVAGSSAVTLGLIGPYMTNNPIPIGGVGGTVNAYLTQPIGLFAAGLSAVGQDGLLNVAALKGHSNVAALVAPIIDCGAGEAVTGFMGTPFLSFFNTVIRVDRPRRVTINNLVYKTPEVQIQRTTDALPDYPRAIAMTFGGLSPATTASYFPVLEPEDLETPSLPTQLSLSPLSIPTGGVFFAEILVLEGEPGPFNTPVSMRVMVDTGAQASIMSPGIAAALNLPMTPDFVVDACGVGGLVTDIPAYYVDYVKINALGGAMEFSRAPFVMLDLASPEGGALDGVLGMNFFWNRNLTFEPSLTGTAFLGVSDPVPFAAGDFDLDSFVDADDAATFQACFGGPASAVTPDCDHVDIDADGDVDLNDFAAMQACFNGSIEAAGVDCRP